VKKFAPILAAIVLACSLATVATVTTGCNIFGPVEEGHSAVVVNAERTAKLSFYTVDGFLEWEHANRPFLSSDITKAADEVREKFPPAYKALRDSTKLYKFTRDPDDESKLTSSLKIVQGLLNIASGLLPPPERALAETKAAKATTIPTL